MSRWFISGHLPSIELHGMFKECVPMLINLFTISYFSIWLGSEMLRQNLSVAKTNRILLLDAPNLHLSSKGRYSQIFSNNSFGRCSNVVVGISGLNCFLKSLYDSNPFWGCTARSTLFHRSCFLNLQFIRGCDAMKQ